MVVSLREDHYDTQRHLEFLQSLYVILVSLVGIKVLLPRTLLLRKGKSEIRCVFPRVIIFCGCGVQRVAEPLLGTEAIFD